MKKLLLLVCFAMASATAFSQSISYGIKGGANFGKLVISAEGTDLTVTSGTNTSFNAGIFADFKLSKFSIQPAINLMGKGGKFSSDMDGEEGGASGFAKLNLLYLQVPVDLLYHVEVVAGDIFFGAGPYIAYGISGKGTANVDGNTVSEDVKFGSDEEFKSTEAGLNITAGVKLKGGLLFNVNYDFGFTNIANDSDVAKLKTRTLGLSVGYAF
jgi:hypothetical protein